MTCQVFDQDTPSHKFVLQYRTRVWPPLFWIQHSNTGVQTPWRQLQVCTAEAGRDEFGQPGMGPGRLARVGAEKKRRNYRRYPKPPYSYVALIALAIQRSPEKQLTLAQILRSMAPVFVGSYRGWRDSVRHNLTANKCFYKVLKDPSKPQSKGNYWAVNVDLIPREMLRRQRTTTTSHGSPVTQPSDLAPFLGVDQPCSPPSSSSSSSTPSPGPLSSDCPFNIDSLLKSRPIPATARTSPDDLNLPECSFASHTPVSQPALVLPTQQHLSVPSWSYWSNSSPGFGLGLILPSSGIRGHHKDSKSPHGSGVVDMVAQQPLQWELPAAHSKATPPNVVLNQGLSPLPYLPHGWAPELPLDLSSIACHSQQRFSVIAPSILDYEMAYGGAPPNKSVFDAMAVAIGDCEPGIHRLVGRGHDVALELGVNGSEFGSSLTSGGGCSSQKISW
uniref:Fork-head domain-containing protein n=1 Tax=Eptatretus burgeri TaxID=7764 RepID=A0A8C4WWG4_EPTBU